MSIYLDKLPQVVSIDILHWIIWSILGGYSAFYVNGDYSTSIGCNQLPGISLHQCAPEKFYLPAILCAQP